MTTRNEDMSTMSLPIQNLEHGLTKRELFAMVAMHGFCTDNSMVTDNISKEAVDVADALLAELNKAGVSDE